MNGQSNLVQRFGRGRLILLLVGIVMVALVVFSLSTRPTKKEQQASTNPTGYRVTADEFINAMTRRDATKGYPLLTEVGQQLVGPQEEWQRQLNEAFKQTPDTTFVSDPSVETVNGAYKDQDPHMVTYSYELHGARWETSLTVIKEQDTWKVDYVRTVQK
jgi:hypothetical protein